MAFPRCALAACVLLASVGVNGDGAGATANEAATPTATKVASYSFAELSFFMTMAYAQYGKHDLALSIKYAVDVYQVTYSPGLVANTPGDASVVLSGLLMVPSSLDGELAVVALIHGTQMKAELVPSLAFADTTYPKQGHGDYAVYGGMASAAMGYAVLVPDGMGLSPTSSGAYPYVVAEGYAISTFNLHAAAKQLLPELSGGTQTLGSDMVTSGYSEGGYGSLAVHKQSSSATWAAAGVAVTASYPAAGPYDLAGSQLYKSFEEIQTYEAPSYFAYVGHAYTNYVGITDIFASESMAEAADSWFEGSLSRSEVDTAMDSLLGDDRKGLFSDTVLTAIAGKDETNTFVAALKANSLAEPWTPAFGSKIHLCHGASDTIVYPENAAAVLANVPGASATMVGADECTGHADCAPDCLEVLLRGLQADSGGLEAWIESDAGKAVMAVMGVAGVVGLGFAAKLMLCNGRDKYEMIA